MKKIKVLIVDDDQNWLKAMKDFLDMESDISVVATAISRAEALEYIQTHDISIILMDICLTENCCDGIHVASQINQLCGAKVIMLTSLNDPKLITDSFACGAIQYVQKSNYKQIPNIIRLLHKETTPIEIMLKDYTRLRREEQLKALTVAEREVFNLICEGYTQSQIREKLYKSESTLKNQIKCILRKLKASNMREAIQKVSFMGLSGEKKQYSKASSKL